MKKLLKFLGNFALAAVIGFSMVSCPIPAGDNGGNPQTGSGDNPQTGTNGDVEASAAVVNLGEESEWEWLLAAKDGSVMLFDVNETTGRPTRLYLKPADKAVENGITFSFKENGLPDVIECNGYLLYFDNFSGYTFDLAAIAPDGSVEYHFGIVTDKDFDAWNATAESGGARSVYGGRSIWDAIDGGFSTDPVGSALDVLGFVVDIATCFAVVLIPPLVQGCVTGIISFALDTIIFFLEKFLEQYEDGLELSALAKDGYLLVTGALDCVRAIVGKDLNGKAWFDCIGAFVGAVSLITGAAQNLFNFFSSSGTKAEVQEEIKPVPNYVKVNYHANGGYGTVPASQKSEILEGSNRTYITLPDGDGLSRNGYSFIGWSTSPKGRCYEAGYDYDVTGDTSFYAQWRENLPAPTGLTATAGSSSSITLSWSEVSGADGYNIYRTTSASGTYLKVGTSHSTLYADEGLSYATTYYYKVSYYRSDYGESLLSAYASATTMVPGAGTTVTFSGLTADGSEYTTTTTLTLTFSAAIPGLSADDITLADVEGVQKGTLSGSGPVYTLGISGFSESGHLSVSVLKSGYNISNPVRSTNIYYLAEGSGGGPGIVEIEGMVYVRGGTFQLGKTLGSKIFEGWIEFPGNKDVTPISNVTLSGFYIGKYEVTQAQWYAVMGTTIVELQNAAAPDPYKNGNWGRGNAYPVYYVSWYDALVFCNTLSIMEGLTPAYRIANSTNPDDWGTVPTSSNDATWDAVTIVSGSTGYRLPTEAQWEYAAKGGDPTAPGWVGYNFAGSDTADNVAWYMDNGFGLQAHTVGTKAPNGLGLYDMSGNVQEWCWAGLYAYTSDDKIDPTGPLGTTRIVRGGYYQSPQTRNDGALLIVTRKYKYPYDRSEYLGFRLVRPAQ